VPASRPKFIKVTDMKAIMAYDLLSTPGLVINEKLVSSGRIPDAGRGAAVDGRLNGLHRANFSAR
jgi:hypothetical protein